MSRQQSNITDMDVLFGFRRLYVSRVALGGHRHLGCVHGAPHTNTLAPDPDGRGQIRGNLEHRSTTNAGLLSNPP
jgi:hypothetical protein